MKGATFSGHHSVPHRIAVLAPAQHPGLAEDAGPPGARVGIVGVERHRPVNQRLGDVLAMDRIEEIHRRLPNCHLVMHGSSSVPQDLQDIINKYGGQMKQTFGVPVEEIQRGIKHGVRKINVDTDNRMALTGY
jgi:hypothetical protein